MDNNFMEPPGEELCVTFSPLKVHCLGNLNFLGVIPTFSTGISGQCQELPLHTAEDVHKQKCSGVKTPQEQHCGMESPAQIPFPEILCQRREVQQGELAGGLGTGLLQPGGEKALEQPPGNLHTCPGGHHGNRHDPPLSTAQAAGGGSGWRAQNPNQSCFHHEGS